MQRRKAITTAASISLALFSAATAMAVNNRNGLLVASFPVENADQIMLVTDGGQLIRVPVDGIRIASRATKGVTIFSTAKDEKVVSVERISEPEGDDDADTDGEGVAEGDVEAGDEAPGGEA